MQTVEAKALAYARKLDAMLATGPEDGLHDALVFGVGDLCGGLSQDGFAYDLTREIDEYEASQVAALGRWAAHASREAAARNWLDAALAVLANTPSAQATTGWSSPSTITPRRAA